MTARLLPHDPRWTTNSEREVAESLRAQAPDDWTIVANLVLAADSREHEVDLLVLMPDLGVVVVETKGGSVYVDATGSWRQQSGSSDSAIDPVTQVLGNKYTARRYVESDPRWGSRARVRWGHAVVLPYSRVDEDFAMPDLARYAVHDRMDLPHLAVRLREIASRQERGHRAPTLDDCDLILEILHGRNLPQRDIAAVAAEREDMVERLTTEQAMLLRVTRLLNRVEVRGGAGSGKTVLAMAQAKDLARGGHDRARQRVALLCYSIGLASFFERSLRGLSRARRPAYVGTFEGFAREQLGVAEFGTREDTDFWESELPSRMSELVSQLPPGKRFDAIVVDEAQDFADAWWQPLIGALKDETTGGLFVYTDENQRVFPRFGSPPVRLVPLVLDHNLRNTKQIADVFAPLTPMRMYARGGEGPDVSFVPAAPGDALAVADQHVAHLVAEGWPPQQIALITTGRRHPEQVSLQETVGQEGYWATFWEEDRVFYGHVLGCKGLERKAVVLCVNETRAADRSREKLYVGLSRATDRLVVVGDPEVIRSMGGPEVAKRLGL